MHIYKKKGYGQIDKKAEIYTGQLHRKRIYSALTSTKGKQKTRLQFISGIPNIGGTTSHESGEEKGMVLKKW